MDTLKRGFCEIGFCSDSRSWLEVLNGLIPRHRANAEIKDLVKQHCFKISGHWIKVQIGLPENEKADALEKPSTECPGVDVVVK